MTPLKVRKDFRRAEDYSIINKPLVKMTNNGKSRVELSIIATLGIHLACPHQLQSNTSINCPRYGARDAVIAQRLDGSTFGRPSRYIIAAGGKRLRPALLLLMCGALGYKGDQRFNLAAVVEFIHTATLLHDDVVDASELRRGLATANESFGNPASVLVGDFLYSRAFQMMVDANDMRVMQILSDATNVIAEGEVMQLMNIHNADLDEAAYLRVIRSKTAKLFEASARLAPFGQIQ
jgi:geranylgeranyl pyrophosphate synthase